MIPPNSYFGNDSLKSWMEIDAESWFGRIVKPSTGCQDLTFHSNPASLLLLLLLKSGTASLTLFSSQSRKAI